jgi:hypothetical protein
VRRERRPPANFIDHAHLETEVHPNPRTAIVKPRPAIVVRFRVIVVPLRVAVVMVVMIVRAVVVVVPVVMVPVSMTMSMPVATMAHFNDRRGRACRTCSQRQRQTECRDRQGREHQTPPPNTWQPSALRSHD